LPLPLTSNLFEATCFIIKLINLLHCQVWKAN
jgi:hypothetical protein